MLHVIKPPTISDRLIEACKFEYKTRHLIDGRIVQCDQRISIVAGYMADEVCGSSPFSFMHKDDVRWVMVALRQSKILTFFFSSTLSYFVFFFFAVYDFSSTYGESCYRLMARTGQFIYLRTRGYLDIDRDTNEVRSFVCHNTLISEDEGRKLIRDMKRKFAIMIQDSEYASVECDEPSVENPIQIERAILSLITNLHKNDETDNVSSPAETYISDDQESEAGSTSGKSLNLLAPNVNTIKVSIEKSVKVVGATGRTSISEDSCSEPATPPERIRAPSCSSASSSSGTPPITDTNQQMMNKSRPSVLQKTENYHHRKSPTKLMSAQKFRQQLSPPGPPPPLLQNTINRGYQTTALPTYSSYSEPPTSTQLHLQIKEEPIDSRVPPLPTSADYFNVGSQGSPTQPFYTYADAQQTSPIDHDSHKFDYINQNTSSPTSTSTTTTSTAYIQSSTSGFSTHFNDAVAYGNPSMDSKSYKHGRPTSVLKRTHSIENIDSTTMGASANMASDTIMATKRKMFYSPMDYSQTHRNIMQHPPPLIFDDGAAITAPVAPLADRVGSSG